MPYTQRISVGMDDALYCKINELAKREHIWPSEVIRRILSDFPNDDEARQELLKNYHDELVSYLDNIGSLLSGTLQLYRFPGVEGWKKPTLQPYTTIGELSSQMDTIRDSINVIASQVSTLMTEITNLQEKISPHSPEKISEDTTVNISIQTPDNLPDEEFFF